MDKIDLVDYKTKNLKLILDNLGIKKVLIVDNKKNENLKLASRNIQGVTTISEKSLNVYELMRFQKIIFFKESILSLNSRLNHESL